MVLCSSPGRNKRSIYFPPCYVGVEWERKLSNCFLQAELALQPHSVRYWGVLDLPEETFPMSASYKQASEWHASVDGRVFSEGSSWGWRAVPGALSGSPRPLKLLHVFSHRNSGHLLCAVGIVAHMGLNKRPKAMVPMSEPWERGQDAPWRRMAASCLFLPEHWLSVRYFNSHLWVSVVFHHHK